MKRVLLSIVVVYISLLSVSAQDHPETIIYKINQFKADKDLLYYLRINELIDTAKYQRCVNSPSGDLCISKSGLQTNLTYVNLFGDSTKEVVLQIKYLELLYYFHFYYQQEGNWVKVPDYIFEYGTSTARYPNELLSVRYEEIDSAGESFLFLQAVHEINKQISRELIIYGIQEDGIEMLYSRSLQYYESDERGNSYVAELEMEIVDKASRVFPKKIRIYGRETMYREAFEDADKVNVYSEKTVEEIVSIYKGR